MILHWFQIDHMLPTTRRPSWALEWVSFSLHVQDNKYSTAYSFLRFLNKLCCSGTKIERGETLQTLHVDHPSEEDDDTVYVWVNFLTASLLKVLSSEMDSAEIRNLSQDGERSDFSEKPTRLLKTTYRMSLILAGSISLDSTFNLLLFS